MQPHDRVSTSEVLTSFQMGGVVKVACDAPKTVPLPLGGGSSGGDGGTPPALPPTVATAPSASLPLAIAVPAAFEAAMRL